MWLMKMGVARFGKNLLTIDRVSGGMVRAKSPTP
jgi:hypothetical protein